MQRKELIINLDVANNQYLIHNHQECIGEFTRELVSLSDSRLLSAQLLIPNNGSQLIVIYKDEEVFAKQCIVCRNICKIDEFHNSKSNFANKLPTCKECVSNRNKRSINNSLTVEETNETFISKNYKSETETLDKHFELNTYEDLRVQRIIMEEERMLSYYLKVII